MSLVQTTAMLQAIITDVTQAAGGVAGVLNGTKMILFENDLTPDETTLLADLTRPTDANLTAAQALTWSAAHRGAGGILETETGLMSWIPVNGVNPTVIYGYAIVNTAVTVLLAAERLPAPAVMTDALSFLGLISRWSPNNDDPGTCTVVS